MSGRNFIDSNIAIYAISDNGEKGLIGKKLLYDTPIISTQVVAESINVILKKFKFTKEEAFEKAADLIEVSELTIIKASTLKSAFNISIKYQFSCWDSLIIACALESDCEILYSEDMQHNLLIDDKLRVLNPFL